MKICRSNGHTEIRCKLDRHFSQILNVAKQFANKIYDRVVKINNGTFSKAKANRSIVKETIENVDCIFPYEWPGS